MPKYVDLFAGCGGLSLGLEKAGFDLALAVEKSDMAAETFFHNFIERISDLTVWKEFAAQSSSVEDQAAKKLVVKELSSVLECPSVLSNLKSQDIDLVAGGPPCQGFSLAGRRNPDDVRNQLPWQFLEFVEEIEPKAVLIENVSGISQNFRKHGRPSPFEELRLALSETGTGYAVQPILLNAMHFGVPQHRPRVMLIGIRSDIALTKGLSVSTMTWKSQYDFAPSTYFDKRPRLAPPATHFGDSVLTVESAISDLGEQGYNRRRNISDFAIEMRNDTYWGVADTASRRSQRKARLENHVLRRHAPRIELRFRVYQYLQSQGVPLKVMGIPKDDCPSTEGKNVLISEMLASCKLPAVSPDGTVVAESAQDLIHLIMELGTRKHSQRPLKWSAPSPTVVSLPDDYVHPREPRTLTVRELARFQSFPDHFQFRSKETTGSTRRRFEVPQYTQVGNAVPPRLAEAVGKHIYELLDAGPIAEEKGN